MSTPGGDNYLNGIRVLDFGHYIAGAGAGATLASLGADVIKVEPLQGEPTRHNVGGAYIKMFNHSKRAIALNLSTEGGREVARALADKADVVIQNMRPGSMARYGLDAASLRARNPRLVYLSLCGFPSGGPSADRAGYDVAAQAESGMMWVTGEPDGPPEQVGSAIVDVASMHLGVQAILAALLRRARTGRGDAIEVSLLEVAVALQAQRWSGFLYSGDRPTRIGNRQPALAPAAELLSTSDGYVVVSAYLQDHWLRLCDALGREDLAVDPRFVDVAHRVRHHAELVEELNRAASAFSSESLADLLARRGIVVGRVKRYEEVRDGEDLRSTGMLQDVPGTDHQTFGLPYRSAMTARHTPRRPPVIGEHTAELLRELGLRDDAVLALVAQGAVGMP